MSRVASIDPHDATLSPELRRLVGLGHALEIAALREAGFRPRERPADAILARVSRCIGAFVTGSLIGLLGLAPDVEEEQTLLSVLVVQPEHQRKGVARALIAEAVRQEGGRLVVLAASSNVAALSLYHRMGFAPYRTGAVGEDAPVMIKLRWDLQTSRHLLPPDSFG